MNLEDLQDASIDDPRFGLVDKAVNDGENDSETHDPASAHSNEPRFAADGSFRKLHANYVAAARIGGWIATANVAVVLPIGVGILVIVKSLPFAASLALSLLAFFILEACVFGAHFWPLFEYRHTRWRLDTDGLEIRRGVIWRHTISVPRERIQHTDVARGPIQRRYGLATLSVNTAGTHHSQIDLAGISYETAQAIRNYLLEDAKSAGSESDLEEVAGELEVSEPGAVGLPPMTEASVESLGTALIEKEEDET